MPIIADADPIAAVIGWLQVHPAVLDAFGEDNTSGLNEPPYPRLRVSSSPGGSDGDLIWLATPEILLETYGDPDGSQGSALLRRLHFVALAAIADMPRRTHTADMAVVTNVAPSSAAVWSPLPLGQPRWASTLLITIHPPLID